MRDRFGREITYLRMSVTELCNLRCRYCMSAEGVCKRSHDEMLSREEMLRTLRVAAELGVRKLRVTGARRWPSGISSTSAWAPRRSMASNRSA